LDLAAQRGPAVGAQVGYSRSDLAGADADLIQSRQGALTGVFLTFPIGAGISVRPELLFALKGGRAETVAESGETALLDIDLAYLELPLLAWVTLGRGRFRPVLFGGAAPAVQIGCDFQVDLPDVGQSGRITCGETDANFREWDFGIVAGAGFEVRWPKAALGLEARYTRGLQSVIEDIEVRNRMFGVLLALTF
jgi:hypothetical protein